MEGNSQEVEVDSGVRKAAKSKASKEVVLRLSMQPFALFIPLLGFSPLIFFQPLPCSPLSPPL